WTMSENECRRSDRTPEWAWANEISPVWPPWYHSPQPSGPMQPAAAQGKPAPAGADSKSSQKRAEAGAAVSGEHQAVIASTASSSGSGVISKWLPVMYDP